MLVLVAIANALAPLVPVLAMTTEQLAGFADRWGLPMALVAFVVVTQIGAGLVDRRARARLDAAREKRDGARETRLAENIERLERAVNRQTAVILAMVDAPPAKVAQYLAAFAFDEAQREAAPRERRTA